jgi:hypothetical protein
VLWRAAGLTPQSPGTPAKLGNGLLTSDRGGCGGASHTLGGLVLGLLLLALVLWIALGLDRSRRHRLHDQRHNLPNLAGHHRHRAVPHHRRLRRNGAVSAPLTKPVDRQVFLAEVVIRRGVWQDSLTLSFQERRGTGQEPWGSERVHRQVGQTGAPQVIIVSEPSAEAACEFERVDLPGRVVAAQRHAATLSGNRTYGHQLLASHQSAPAGISIPSHVPDRPMLSSISDMESDTHHRRARAYTAGERGTQHHA